MKRIIIIIALAVLLLFDNIIAINNNVKVMDMPLAKDYNNYKVFDITIIPNDMFYKLNTDYRYILNNKNYLVIKNLENSEKLFYILINDNVIQLGDEDYNPRTDASAYIINSNNKLCLLIDRMHENDCRFYNLYSIINNKIELVETGYGRIDFVGYDYIIGYTYLGMIGYQKCEFKKVLKNGKFELDGEYKVVGTDDSNPSYPIWKFYTLVKDLKYEEYNEKTKKHQEKVLKAGTKIRSLSTDAKSYIIVETESGEKGKVKVDKVEGMGENLYRNFIVNGQEFMNYYFLDGSKYDYEVFSSLPAY